MIVMPQLYQHEIPFKAHDAMGHQGNSQGTSENTRTTHVARLSQECRQVRRSMYDVSTGPRQTWGCALPFEELPKWLLQSTSTVRPHKDLPLS